MRILTPGEEKVARAVACAILLVVVCVLTLGQIARRQPKLLSRRDPPENKENEPCTP